MHVFHPATSGRHSLRLPWALFVCAMVTTLLGCAKVYQPVTPRRAMGDGYDLTLDSLHLGGGLLPGTAFVVRVRVHAVPERTTLRRVAVAAAEIDRCRGGVESSVHGTEGQWVPGDLTLREGEELLAGFPPGTWSGAQSQPSRLDISLADSMGVLTCITFPLVDATPEQRWQSDTAWSLGAGIGGTGFVGSLGDIDRVITFPMTLGRWVGPVRPSIEFAPGSAACRSPACSVGKGSEFNYSPYMPLTLGLDAGRSFGSLRLGLGAGYRGAWSRVDATSGSYHVWLHGPVVTPRLGVSIPEPAAPGVPGGERMGGFAGVEFPVSLTWDDHQHRAFGIGINLVLLAPL